MASVQAESRRNANPVERPHNQLSSEPANKLSLFQLKSIDLPRSCLPLFGSITCFDENDCLADDAAKALGLENWEISDINAIFKKLHNSIADFESEHSQLESDQNGRRSVSVPRYDVLESDVAGFVESVIDVLGEESGQLLLAIAANQMPAAVKYDRVVELEGMERFTVTFYKNGEQVAWAAHDFSDRSAVGDYKFALDRLRD